MSRLALRFISGRYKGEDHLLAENKETIIGRSASIELVLVEDMVSRKHAQITVEDGVLHIEDLGSTNGTFVNGEKIAKTTIKKGDRILIGTSIMKVVEIDEDPTVASSMEHANAAEAIPSRPAKAKGGSRNTIQAGSSISGTISEVPLPDLIQLFGTSKKTGTLVIDRKGTIGRIHLDKGQIVYSDIEDKPAMSPLKAIFRILSWEEGTFELRGPSSMEYPEVIEMPTEHILMEGLRHLDELRHLKEKFPPMNAELVVVTPLVSRLTDLSKDELEIFQLIYNHRTVRAVVDKSKLSDLEAMKTFFKLLDESYVTLV